jgi:dihydroneopterin aldolase
MLTSISIKGLQTFGYQGLYEEERRLGQKFLFDIHGQLPTTRTHQDDALLASVRYDAVVDEVVSISEGQQFMTIEALGEAIARGLLTRFPPLEHITVAVTKFSPPLKQTIQSAGIEVRLSQAELTARP